MKIQTLHDVILPAAFKLLPAGMRTIRAKVMLTAVALQESGLENRKQLLGSTRLWWENLRSPASGYWQFEQLGIQGVLDHRASRDHLLRVLDELDYHPDPILLWRAVTHNTVLAAVIARLALWRLPQALPGAGDTDGGWGQYMEVWRPGRPHRETWDENFDRAWDAILK